MPDTFSKRQVRSFRLNTHHLDERLGGDGLLDAAAACGIQDSPPGSSLLALHARVQDVTRHQVTDAIAEQKTLLQTWSLRGAPFLFPTADASVFTSGVLPQTETALRHFLPGMVQAVDALGMSISEAVGLTVTQIHDVLSGRRLDINELGTEIAGRIAPRLPGEQRLVWEAEGPYEPGQSLGEGVVHFCVRVLTLRQVVCLAPRAGNKAPFVLSEEWLGRPVADGDAGVGRADLLRRYLHCYGPSTRAGFATWLGLRAGDVDPWWNVIEDELTQVEYGGTAWILNSDHDVLRSTPEPTGVRLLPPHDPYTQLRDRHTIVDVKYHRDLWKAVGQPGTVLTDGVITGTWRPRRRGSALTIAVSSFAPLPDLARQLLHGEAHQVALLRGATSADVVFDTH